MAELLGDGLPRGESVLAGWSVFLCVVMMRVARFWRAGRVLYAGAGLDGVCEACAVCLMTLHDSLQNPANEGAASRAGRLGGIAGTQLADVTA